MLNKILTSRRFWTFVVAQLLSIAVVIVDHYVVDPFSQQIAVMIVSFIEGLAAILIAAYTAEDTIVSVTAMKLGLLKQNEEK